MSGVFDYREITRAHKILELPEPSELTTVAQKSFVALEVFRYLGHNEATAIEIADVLTNGFGVGTTRQAVTSALKGCRRTGEIFRIVRGKTIQYKLMKKGIDAVNTSKDNVVIPAGRQYSSKLLLQSKVLLKLDGRTAICDPYVSARTLDMLCCIGKAIEVRVIVQTIQDEEKFSRALTDFKAEFPNFMFRRYSGSEVHDRYIIDEKGCWHIGHSLKDLGKKDTAVTMGKDIRQSLLALFNERWKSSKDL